MEKQILLPAAEVRRMNKEFKTSTNELARALQYRRNSSRAKMLRAAALQRGGLIYTGAVAPADYIPEVSTNFSGGFMTQTFRDRVSLVVNLSTNVADILVDGERVATFSDMTLGSWSSVVYSLNQIYNQLIAKSDK